jgi:hypothetical protein
MIWSHKPFPVDEHVLDRRAADDRAAAAVIMAALTSPPVPAGLRYALIVALAATMGAQNATARKLALVILIAVALRGLALSRAEAVRG